MPRRAITPDVAPQARASRKPLLFWLLGLLCGTVVVFSPGTLVLTIALFAPLVLVALTEGRLAQGATLTAGLFATAVTMHLFHIFWSNGSDISDGLEILRQPRLLLKAWAAIGGAWLGLEILTLGLRLGLDFSSRRAEKRRQSEIDILLAEWGGSD